MERLIAASLAAGALLLAAQPAQAGLFGLGGKDEAKTAPDAQPNREEAYVREVRRAIDEERYADAGRMLDRAFASGMSDPRLVILTGELHLAQGENEEALTSFSSIQITPALFAQAQTGKGIALSRLGRSGEAIQALREATATDPAAWRAWNALGVEYDRQKNWEQAEMAYAEALKAPEAGAMVYNNRGYSRLLQGRRDEAAADFVTALERDPGFATARTNLRLALAVSGQYDRATTVSGTEDQAAILNNAGFAALMRGDLEEAESLFTQAIDARGRNYARAQENLELTRGLMAQAKADKTAAP
ncbi:MAG TPA: tetratricopeptide repeat protein [Caulobacteraceae bacterium]